MCINIVTIAFAHLEVQVGLVWATGFPVVILAELLLHQLVNDGANVTTFNGKFIKSKRMERLGQTCGDEPGRADVNLEKWATALRREIVEA